MKQTFEEQFSRYRELIETYLNDKCFCYADEPQQELFSSARYSLLAGGKRLRPVFVFDFCAMCGADPTDALCFAAAVEMVHTYSLIHDDLPCMDNDDYRRGKLTNHKVFGEATAVLAGDALLTAAFGEIASAKLDAESRIRAVGVLANCAGELGMVGGQVLDMMSELRVCTEQEVLDIQSRKTGALIRAACMLGVIAGQGSAEQLAAAKVFADNLGIAFQIRDDMLDVIGDAASLGKATGADSGKNTFVRLYGLEKCETLVAEYTEKAVEALLAFENRDFMKELACYLTGRMV